MAGAKWIPLNDILRVVKSALSEVTENTPPKWSWTRNPECKYIDVRIDMRDGSAHLRDRFGAPITLEQLMRQQGHTVDTTDVEGLSYRPLRAEP